MKCNRLMLFQILFNERFIDMAPFCARVYQAVSQNSVRRRIHLPCHRQSSLAKRQTRMAVDSLEQLLVLGLDSDKQTMEKLPFFLHLQKTRSRAGI